MNLTQSIETVFVHLSYAEIIAISACVCVRVSVCECVRVRGCACVRVSVGG